LANFLQRWFDKQVTEQVSAMLPAAVEARVEEVLPARIEAEVEKRSVGISDTAGMMKLLNLVGDGSGVPNVTDHTITTLAPLVRALGIVCGACAKLPLSVYQFGTKGPNLLPNHPAHQLCNVAPDGYCTPYRFWWQMWANRFLSGGAGAEIIRNANGRPVRLRLMRFGCRPYQVWPTDPIRYWDNETGMLYDEDDVLYLPGLLDISGHQVRSLSEMFRDDFGESLAQTLLSKTLFKQGVYPAAVYGYTATKAGLKGDESFSDDISRYFGGLDRAGKVIPIPNMDKFVPLPKVSFVDAQMIQQRKWSLQMIAIMFGLTPDMLGDTEKQSYATVEATSKNFILYTLDPLLTERDQEAVMKLLGTSQRGRVFIETKVDETMWMLPKDRMDFFWKKFQMGAMSADEIRAYDNEPPIPDGSGGKYYVQAQLIPTDQIADFWSSKNATNGTQPTA
jgi:HK97 family phage portal protein